MPKTRKTRKAVESEESIVEEMTEDDEVEEEEEAEEVIASSPVKPMSKAYPVMLPPSQKEFTAVLQNATTLTLAGIKFVRNEPMKVPMAHLKMIRDHGWFRVIV